MLKSHRVNVEQPDFTHLGLRFKFQMFIYWENLPWQYSTPYTVYATCINLLNIISFWEISKNEVKLLCTIWYFIYDYNLLYILRVRIQKNNKYLLKHKIWKSGRYLNAKLVFGYSPGAWSLESNND